ncbi:serine hydrolase domain-containing protein [Spirosoma utsteinense]|uniref:D-alanyl-D-alanine carboxypeptidase n=1 Tax=Spirosoma utsteinense TaxID=2585773 RepID=A0ABR6W6I2_9BACT|nr:serine hydrolase domain-containing protein [Spirosoma utsteinense]MBC3792200.1 D-alanyl-D-alanine carboxypeptidase [Spirosoma utsteinense]
MMIPLFFTRLYKRLSLPLTPISIARFFLIGGLTGLLFGCSLVNVEDHRSPLNSQVQEAVDNARATLEKDLGNAVPSLNVLIQTPTQTYFASSIAPGQQPLTPGTNFRFASATKNFTAAAVMKMYQDGWLNYKALITDLIPGTNQPYVPATPDWNIPNKRTITIEQLLNHSAGVYDVDNDSVPGLNKESYVNYVLSRDSTHQFTAEEMLKPIIRYQLNYFDPTKGYHYSNTGYFILSRIIERVYSLKAGQAKTCTDYMYDHITGPASRVPLPIWFPYRANDVQMPQPSVASLIRRASGRQDGFGPVNMSGHVGEGNGYGTMASLNTYIRSLMKGENVLLPQTVKLLQTDVSAANPTYGLGTSYRQNLGYGHNGAIAGYLMTMTYDPATDVSVIAMLPMWDLTQGPNGDTTFGKCFNSMYDAAYAARAALGFPGKP